MLGNIIHKAKVIVTILIPFSCTFAFNVFFYFSIRWLPVYVDKEQKLGVMSIGFLLENNDDAIIWRGPKKTGMAEFINCFFNVKICM